MTTTVTSNNAPVSSFASNVKTNFQNLSTTKKVALGFATLALVGASVAAFVATHSLIAFSATTLHFAVSSLAVQLTGAGLGTLGLAIPAYALIGAPKKNNESAIEMQAMGEQEEAQGPSAAEQVEQIQAQEQPEVEQSSLSSLRSFAYNHRYLLVAGAVLVTAAVVGGAYLGKDGMKLQGQNLVDAGQKLSGQALEAGKKLSGQALEVGKKLPGQALEAGKKLPGQALEAGKKLPGQAFNFGKNAFAQAYAKLPTFKK